ncbi:outer membrane lipoprotein-sorting protein [Moritella sp. F3]|uniref:outer membrane lipoprotein-sorting protein n=1 Tax=Moritella sp. F3 TaxID=2718882 RepID=UPI0018E1D10A|nr:outer membrane lipoprotein-sorting protein [Moritella sp. F3]GIC78653.1 membrane protein [Moritella sp. F1]GIC79808.1 membrane protein [Moritella sp. F3]
MRLETNEKHVNIKYGLKLTLLFSVLITVFNTSFAMAETTQEKGLSIVVEADKRDQGFGDSSASMEMILTNRHGEQSIRIMRNKTMEQKNDGDKSQIIFDNPRDVKGTAFLSYTHREGADDQWLYLPALKRVKRIASSNKSGPFMGSEFAFEDIASQEVSKYTYNYMKNETFDGREHFVVEFDPKDSKSGYSRQEVFIDTQEYRVWKVNYFNRGGELLKTLSVSDFNQYLGQYWRADTWTMINHKTSKKTVLNFQNWQFDNGFSDRDFSRNSLSRAR